MGDFTVNFSTECTGTPPTAAEIRASVANTEKALFFTGTSDVSGSLIRLNFDTNGYNNDTKTWDNASGYIANLPAAVKELIITPPTGSTRVLDSAEVLAGQEAKDRKLIELIRKEYCFYKVRYQAFLQAFLDSIKPVPVDGGNSEKYLDIVISYNNKLNALVLLVNYIKEVRARYVNLNTTAFNTLNTELLTAMQNLGPSSALINSNQAVLNTRKEMVRYTKEKNNAITNQISLWASLNIVAIAMIFHLYRTM